MKHLTILVPNGENNLSSIVGAYKILSRANGYRKELFKIELAGIAEEVSFHGGLFTAKPHKNISEIKHSDLIIVPSLNHNYHQSTADNAELIDWIGWQYRQGAEVASICTGAYLLAAAGLLDGKSCSTHWSAADELKQLYPKVNIKTDLLITDENGIYTNGGAYSFLNLILYLVEKYYGRETAIFCAKVFQIEIDRHSQADFIIFKGQRMHNDDLVKKAQDYIESRLDEKIATEHLAASLAIGRRNFDRRFIKATGNTPTEYAQRVKIEAAKRSFESSRKSISEVMYEVGYADQKAFREVFRRVTGLSPLEYRNRYNKDAA
ncbi:GlxA family transcriptional regulator [Mucilaginibacter flavus]|uniref:GlxA family transcriptional regulator n=1 Tax=Mucilaginibacter flavus TaxID=931504 RepID=UPI0025B3B77A|nr:helix-turn-helix domain-containing protein [Mucilaginibacter flavus]MDN3582917.1 helix-turn-helix domain-containing protein [Mucilaginibacter flavus]